MNRAPYDLLVTEILKYRETYDIEKDISHDCRHYTIKQERPKCLLYDFSLSVQKARHGADRHDVVDADHVAHSSADCLSSYDKKVRKVQLLCDVPLEQTEKRV